MKNNLPNGGFPPIIVCSNKKEKENKFSKERYGSENKKNISKNRRFFETEMCFFEAIINEVSHDI